MAWIGKLHGYMYASYLTSQHRPQMSEVARRKCCFECRRPQHCLWNLPLTRRVHRPCSHTAALLEQLQLLFLLPDELPLLLLLMLLQIKRLLLHLPTALAPLFRFEPGVFELLLELPLLLLLLSSDTGGRESVVRLRILRNGHAVDMGRLELTEALSPRALPVDVALPTSISVAPPSRGLRLGVVAPLFP